MSLAVLGDEVKTWRPDQYRDGLLGCDLEFRFTIVKLLDYTHRMEELEESDNPFAVLVLSHLKSQQTRHDPESRFQWKYRLVRGLFEKRWSKEKIRSLFHFVD